jgi:hypothetical protein
MRLVRVSTALILPSHWKEDLLRDTNIPSFQGRIGESVQNEHFRDVTSKCIKTLVSGLTLCLKSR